MEVGRFVGGGRLGLGGVGDRTGLVYDSATKARRTRPTYLVEGSCHRWEELYTIQ